MSEVVLYIGDRELPAAVHTMANTLTGAAGSYAAAVGLLASAPGRWVAIQITREGWDCRGFQSERAVADYVRERVQQMRGSTDVGNLQVRYTVSAELEGKLEAVRQQEDAERALARASGEGLRAQ